MRVKSTVKKKYLVLSSNMIDPIVADGLEARSKTLATARQAQQFAVSEKDGWTFQWLDDRTGLLQKNGLDVAMFYKRQFVGIHEAEDAPVEHAPAKTLKDEDEAWMRISLLETKSAFKQAQFFTREYEQVAQEAKQYKALHASTRSENEMLQGKILQLEKQLEKELEKQKAKP